MCGYPPRATQITCPFQVTRDASITRTAMHQNRKRSSLVFPDGVRLARLDELPGPELTRAKAWESIQSAAICPGFRANPSGDPRFSTYAEANVDAPEIWGVFVALCEALIRDVACLLIGNIDDELSNVGPFSTTSLLRLLEAHRYQLANDGSVQFGLIEEREESIVEILVTPTKHFKVWTSDERALRTAFARHGIAEVTELQFLDQFPRTTESLGQEQGVVLDAEELVKLLREGPQQPRH